jgi:polyisoprenoid-binding protein YceI
MMKLTYQKGLAALLLILLLAACGGDSDEPAATLEAIPVEPATSGDLRVYEISPADSTVRFELDEDLRGERQTVVGSGNGVAGQIAADFNDLSTAEIGVIQIDATTLETDRSMRNQAIGRWILETGNHQFITFTPTAIEGLPESAAVGEELNFTISGDLTIRDITQPVTFNVTATAVSETQLSGTASAVIQRGDFDLTIPNVPNVANVEEEVELYIEFVANAAP